ncbi:MAG TPA: enolase C-terminal domain-like protein, partial [Candidatus Limnocylindrales bacterium]|nr:enolase C-terminal domain-like protein [Candidatus Limnocylindrales bacterium]
MKIVDLRATPVTVPAEAPWRWSMGIETGTTRTIIELITDEGIVGIGETYGGVRTVEALEVAKPFIIGLDPLETGLLQHRLSVFCIGYEMSVPPLVRAGIEMASLDAAGKALDRTVASLLGGAVRDGVDVASYLFYRYPSDDGKLPAVDTAEAILDRANELVERNGHRVHKLKGGVLAPTDEYRALKLLRERFPDDPLVWDPNAAWSVETTIRVGRRLTADAFDLQWLEDPCNWLEGMSRA